MRYNQSTKYQPPTLPRSDHKKILDTRNETHTHTHRRTKPLIGAASLHKNEKIITEMKGTNWNSDGHAKTAFVTNYSLARKKTKIHISDHQEIPPCLFRE